MKIDNKWDLIEWDLNPDLRHQCYRKYFGKGHVSIGIGNFKHIVYFYGNNSENSISSTRWRETGDITPEQAMTIVDRNNGKYNPQDNNP